MEQPTSWGMESPTFALLLFPTWWCCIELSSMLCRLQDVRAFFSKLEQFGSYFQAFSASEIKLVSSFLFSSFFWRGRHRTSRQCGAQGQRSAVFYTHGKFYIELSLRRTHFVRQKEWQKYKSLCVCVCVCVSVRLSAPDARRFTLTMQQI